MSKQLICQKYIYKIRSSRLRKAKWKLTLPLSEARINGELVSLGDSQVLRWLDELNGVIDGDLVARDIKAQILAIRKEKNGVANRRKLKQLYSELDAVQFKPDYLCVIMDRISDYHRACKGFSINGVRYKRLLGTNGGVKNSTIVFMSERHIDEIRRRIDNGRDMTKPMVPAKLEAYKALACSASNPVSMPNGILVVNDCETQFYSDIVYLNDENADEPVMEDRKHELITMNATDGCGVMMPSLAKRWSEELQLDYVVPGVNTRFCWEKGMVFTFDFQDFADKVAGSYIVKDAWGNDVDVRNVELVLTTSMVKLWDSYESCDAYIENSVSNKYTFGITKTCPEELENERDLNYQFIQSYDLDDDAIDRLIKPTIDEIKDILHDNVNKTVLYAKGTAITKDAVAKYEANYIKAMMIDPRVIDDPYVTSRIFRTIKHRIDEAKIGCVKVHGNYSIVSGDPYSLCQSMFGLPVTGILKAGEIYNKYWSDYGSEKLACFRAPMTCHNNIRLVRPHRSPEAEYWYRYMSTCTIFNSWDTASSALNGCDYDGDLVMLTDNDVLVDNLRELPALMCVQRKAEKIIVTEADAIRANINSFGDDIGKTTNRITSMFGIQSLYDKDSEEYRVLDYRIKCGQLYQQNAIDKAKGIIAKPMPREWFDGFSIGKIEDPEKSKFYRRIVADKKPYFMRMIYPVLRREYNQYIKNVNKNSYREFGISLSELTSIPETDLTERQKVFLFYYRLKSPVSDNDCVMNKICHRFENEFDRYLSKRGSDVKFDYSILKSNKEYHISQYNKIVEIYGEYRARYRDLILFADRERLDREELYFRIAIIGEEFSRRCFDVCSNEETLCDILVDICYKKNRAHEIAWSLCGGQIIRNLLASNNNTISYPVEHFAGDIEFRGKKFRVESGVINE